MRIGTRLSAGYALIVIILLALAGYSGLTVTVIMKDLDGIYTRMLPGIDFLDQADRDLYQLVEAERSMFLVAPTSPEAADFAKAYDENYAQSVERMGKYAALSETEAERKLYAEYQTALKSWTEASNEAFRLARLADPKSRAEGLALSLGKTRELFGAMRDKINSLEDIVNENATASAPSQRPPSARPSWSSSRCPSSLRPSSSPCRSS